MSAQSSAAAPAAQRPSSLLPLALWVGFVTGFAEIAKVALDLLPPPGYLGRSRDAIWMIPAVDAGLFGMLGVLLMLVARWVRLPWHVAAGTLAGLGALLPLLLIDWLHPLAALVLAIGVGTQAVRLLKPRVPAAQRVVSRTLPWLGGSVCALAVITVGWRIEYERWLAHTRPAAQPGAPNVILLILDTVRAADLSLYGYARPTTPELERFAQHATVFDHAFSAASWTLPSHASIFTGRWAPELGVRWGHQLDSPCMTLAEVLRARGYSTAAFVANQLYTGWETGFSQGFEHFEDYPVSLWTAIQTTAFGRVLYPKIRSPLAPILNRVPVLWRLPLPLPDERPSALHIIHSFLAWVDAKPVTPFFAFLNFMDGHEPYTAPESFLSRFHSRKLRPPSPAVWDQPSKQRLTPADARQRQDAYDGAIAYLDFQLGRIFRELEYRGLLANTLVVITADHGEEFAEHGLLSHGNSLYRRSLEVPLILRFPRHVPQGQRISGAVSLRNVAATVLDLLPPGQSAAFPGHSLARFWTDSGAVPDTILAFLDQDATEPAWYPNSRGDVQSIGFAGLRYIRNQGDGSEELYDFEHDVLERWNLAGSDSGRRLLPRYRAALAATLGSAPETRLTVR